MAIDLATGFNIGSKDAIDERQVLTLEQMKNLDESIYPDKYFAICKDDGKLYLFNASNEINDETGKFREISGSENVVDTDNFLKSYTELSQLGLSSDVGVWEVIQALAPGAMAHIRTNGFDNASTIFPITDSGVLYIVKGKDDVYLHGTQVMWTSKQGGCAIGVIGSGSFEGWNVISGSLSSNKKLIFNKSFTINDYTLLAKIVLPDDSIYRHNIRITCAHKINTSNYSNWTFKEDIDICKFDLHFTNPPLTTAYVDDPTMKLYGLTLYEYPFPEGTDEGIKKISKNIRLYYDKTSYTIYVYLFNNENLFEGEMGRQLIGLTVENKGDIEIAESLLSDGVWNAPWNCQCEFDDLEAPTIVKVGGADEDDSTTSTYTSLTELGLTADATVQDVVDALSIGDTALLRTDGFTNWSTLFNGIQWGYLKVEKTASGLSNIELQEVVLPNRRYFGAQSGGKFSKWQKVASEIADVLTNNSTIVQVPNANLVAGEIHGKYFNIVDYSDALAMPAGKWRVDSNSKASQMQNLPVSKAGILEVKYLHGNDGTTAYTGSFKYAMLTYTVIDGNTYERSFNSDGTVGNIVNDTGWQQIITENSKTDPYSCTGYTVLTGTEDLFTLPCGHYATAKADKVYNYPITDSSSLTAHIYVLGCLNDPANNKGYRIILYFDNKGRMYRINEWWGSFANGWQQIGSTTLVTNTATLKLDVTKRNSSWYGAIKLTYLYDTSPTEIEISFRSATDDLRWAVINGQKYVKQITFTQDSGNVSHYTIGIEFSGTTYGCYQAEVIGGFADINSLTSETFTGAKTAVYYSPWGKNNGVTLVSAPEDIGLTYPCTTVQLAQAMRNKFNKTINAGAIGIFNCGGNTVTITDAPANYGLLHIETFGYDRIMIRFDGIASSNYEGSWIGQIKSSNGTFSSITWKKIGGNDIAKTTLTLKIENAGAGNNFYFVKNGICYVNYYFVSQNSESAGTIIFDNLPKPAETMNVTVGATWAEVRADTTNLYITGAMGPSASCVGNFSYPVAD